MLPWSDNWWIEDKKAYFCGAEIAALFCVDLDDLQCDLLAVIPESEVKSFRINPYCVKYGHCIYCIPGKGKNIWYYDLKNSCWDKINLMAKPGNAMKVCPIIYDSKMWIENCYNGNILEVNLLKKNIEWEYKLPMVGNSKYGGRYVVANGNLYCVNEKIICCINIITRKIKKYDMTSLGIILFAIFFDGENFWLSGNCKKIYIWNPENGIIKEITNFPSNLGVYQPREDNSLEIYFDPKPDSTYFLFDHIIGAGNYVWFIPFFANQIVYVDKESYCINTLDIHTENYAVARRPPNMYRQLLEYIRDNRYIGIYSSKADCIFEIDAEDLNVEYKEYKLKSEHLQTLADQISPENHILLEGYSLDESLYTSMISKNYVKSKMQCANIGEKIYKDILRIV